MSFTTVCWCFFVVCCWVTTVPAEASNNTINCPLQQQQYSPCNCHSSPENGTISIDCGSRGLDDSKASKVLQSFITDGVGIVTRIDFDNNRLTKVPYEIRLFHQLEHIYLNFNQIQYIAYATFNSTGALYLIGNQINTIAPGAFQGNYNKGSFIWLYDNSLVRFEQQVFQSVLEQMSHYGGYLKGSYLYISNNPIDCESDPCHLAWLIRDNRHLLKAIYHGGTCLNGTRLEDLNPNTICTTFRCPSSNGLFVHPEACTSFYMCSNGLSYSYQCPIDEDGRKLSFNPIIGVCDKTSSSCLNQGIQKERYK